MCHTQTCFPSLMKMNSRTELPAHTDVSYVLSEFLSRVNHTPISLLVKCNRLLKNLPNTNWKLHGLFCIILERQGERGGERGRGRGKEGGRWTVTDFWFHKLMHPLVYPCTCPDWGLNPRLGILGRCSNQSTSWPGRKLHGLLPSSVKGRFGSMPENTEISYHSHQYECERYM